MKENADYFIKKMNKANGGTRAHLLFKNGFGANICYHPLGGCVLGEATNEFGKLKNHDHLFVLDGSLIPGTIGVNPFVTIAAIAEYCIENLINQNEFLI
jgi:cholesterol oxidase